MKSQYKRDITREYFLPLEQYNFNPSLADNKQLVLAKNLHRTYGIKYGIPESKILKLIMYADSALSHASISERVCYLSDARAIAGFEKNPDSIDKVVFTAGARTFEITNPYLIDKLYYCLKEISESRIKVEEIKYPHYEVEVQKYSAVKHINKKRSSGAIIKKVATELYNELTVKEKITGSKPLYLIGYIFSLYNVGLKREEPILTDIGHQAQNKVKKSKGITTESYLQYLAGRIKRYINK